MATYTITVPVDRVNGVIEGAKLRYGYQENVSDGEGGTIPNPETPAQFTRRMILEIVKSLYVEYKESLARTTMDTTVKAADIESETITIA